MGKMIKDEEEEVDGIQEDKRSLRKKFIKV